MADRLHEAFAYVRSTFFPLWDRGAEWSVSEVVDLPVNGKSDETKKTITVHVVADSDDELYCLLIHEICHAVASAGHGKKWLDRLVKAGDRARLMGRQALADLIYDEVERYAKAERHLKVIAELVYNTIEDLVFYNPSATYDAVIDTVALQFGFYREELLDKYTRCREVYDGAVAKYTSW
ncbi:MAG TPA: hypothetical protein VMU60_00190 [Syntrophobacteria bacterium]|nr:hypothetical protein [Syntrophobacteria bacterium]